MEENKHIKEFDAFAKKYLKEIKTESLSKDFTASLMNKIVLDTTTPSNTTDTIINPATTTIESNGLRKKSDSSDFETPKIEEINGNMQERNEDETHHLSYAQSPPPESRPPLPRPPPPPPSGQSLTSSGKKRGRPKGSKTRFRTLKADGTTIRIAVPTSEELKMSGENEGGSETENVSGGSIESDSGGNGSGGEERIDEP